MIVWWLAALAVAVWSLAPNEAVAAPSAPAAPDAQPLRDAAGSLRKMCAKAPDILVGNSEEVREAVIRVQVADAFASKSLQTERRSAIESMLRDPQPGDQADKLERDLPAVKRLDAELGAATVAGTDKILDDTKRDTLCTQICGDAATVMLDVCAFEDAALAEAALRIDPGAVAIVLAHVEKRLAELTKLDTEQAKAVEDYSPYLNAKDDVREAMFAGLGAGVLPFVGAEQIGAFINTAAQALAKVIVDRAKREAIGWLLDTMAAEVCVSEKDKDAAAETEKKWVREEIERHWLPNLCTLAKKDRAAHYGAGAAQLSALRAAVRADVGGLPGAAVGLGLGHLFLETALRPVRSNPRLPGATEGVVMCHTDERKPAASVSGFNVCTDALQVRSSAEAAMRAIVEGSDPRTALDELATEIDRVNLGTTAGAPPIGFLKSPQAQLLACALSMGRAVGDEPTKPSVLVGLLEAPACWTLVGSGYENLAVALATPGTKPVLAIDTRVSGQQFEQLSTLVRLHKKVRRPTERLLDASKKLAAAAKRVAELEDDAATPQDVRLPAPPTFDGTKKPAEAADAASTYLEDALASQLQLRRAKHLHAIADVLEAAADVASTTLDLLESVQPSIAPPPGTELLPGLKYADPIQGASAPTVAMKFTATTFPRNALRLLRVRVATIKRAASLARAIGDEDWGRAGNDGFALLIEAVTEVRKRLATTTKDPKKGEPLTDALDPLGKHLGTLAAIATAKDSDEMAEALDAAANPPGGWRSKLGKGNFTASLTAHAGLMGAYETRHGIYGAQFENWSNHGQAPTLFLPFGLELAWGLEKTVLALFFPIIDPAAFLGYDLGKGGRLPGPNPLTVLGPGIAGRVAFGKSPFGLMPFVLFRPRYRTWEPTANGPGAHVVQIGAAITVDVTLFRLFSRGR